MKSKNISFKLFFIVSLLIIVLNSIVASPLVYAQGEISPTPTETQMGGFLAPTSTPTPTLSSPELQESEQPFSSFQSMQEFGSSLEAIWPAFNISDTGIPSIDASIAVDNSGKIHFVWEEDDDAYGTEPEVYYAVWDGEKLSRSVNISLSPSIYSRTPQIVADGNGKAHIVWGEDDTSDSDVFYSKCGSENNQITCSTPVNLSGPPDRQCGGRVNPWPDLDSGNPVIGIDGVGNLRCLVVISVNVSANFILTQTRLVS